VSKHLLLLNEIAKATGEARTLPGALHAVLGLVAREMKVDVCAVWLLDATGIKLRLAAIEGLPREAVGQVLEQGEGLTWQVLIRNEPVLQADVAHDPHFIYIPAMHEEDFHSYLGLPLIVRGEAIGALYVQTREAREYSADEVRALLAIASQIAPVVDNARLLALVADEESTPVRKGRTGPRRAQGTPCSTGVASGEIVVLDGRLPAPPRKTGSRKEEGARLERACDKAREELLRMQGWLRGRHAEEAALVFTVQLMLLEDQGFTGRMRASVDAGFSAHDAIRRIAKDVLKRFQGMSNIYFRERAQDINDLASRLMRHAGGRRRKNAALKGKVAVLPRLTPSRMVSLCAEGVAAVLTGGGGATSHAALLARSLDLPLVVGLRDFVNDLCDGQYALVDAASGEVVVDPPEPMVAAAARAAAAGVKALHELEQSGGKGSGRIRFEANVSLWGDTVRAAEQGADGIGLYRTEFAFLMRPDLPGEEEQKVLYHRVVEAIAPKPVTFRLLDAGGDKLVPALGQTSEPNPFLGYRSLRLLLDHPEILRAQARAIFDALKGTDGRLMVPMVASWAELKEVKDVLKSETDRLPLFGAMIEVPSAIMQIDEIAAEVDFLCIGTNDLIQYMLGVDRTNARVTRFFEPCHPALIRALHLVATAAKRADKCIGICGEMASNPLLLPLWLGLGIDRLSVHATRLRALRALESKLDADSAREAVEELIGLRTAEAIRARLESLASPEVLEFVRVRHGV